MKKMQILTVNGNAYQISDPEAVSFSEVQSLTPEQQQQARKNIGAASGTDLEAIHNAAASAIVCEDSGEVVTVADSSDRLLQGLTLYGKTTQDGIPAPDAPVGLVSAGDGGSIGVTVAGKNLFDEVAWFESNGFTKQSDGSWLGVQIAKPCWTNTAKKSGRMYITAIVKAENSNYVPAYLWAVYTDGTRSAYITIHNIYEFTKQTVETDPDKTVDYIRWHYGGGGVYYIKDIQFSFVDDEYEPYKELQTLTASTPNGLNGVPMPPTVADGFSYAHDYIDADGKAWITDYVDYARGVRVQRFKTATITQAHDFHDVKNGFGQFYINLPEDRKLGSYCLCSHYNIPINNDLTLYHNPTYTGAVYKRISSRPGLLMVSHEGITTLDEYNAWLAENQPVFLYELAEPIETPLSAEELAQYAALHTNKPNTTVYNDSGAGMALEYVADTKTYIDNKFNELAAAFVNNT